MLCYILAQYAPQVHENILLFFWHKKQSHRNCCRILNINLVIGICKFNSSKLQMLPTPGYVSTNSYPANCRCFQPQPGICKSNFSKLQMLPTLTRHLQIQFQQVADASNPDQASANPIPTSCRCFRSWPGICSSNFSKLQMLPTPARHLQLQFQQVADASDPDQASANPIPANCRYFHIRNSPLYVSTSPIPANCRCFQPRPGICKSNSNKLQMLPTLTRHL